MCTVTHTQTQTDRRIDRERENSGGDQQPNVCSKVVSKRNTKKCSPPSPPFSSATTYPLPPSPPSSTSTTRTVVRSPASNTVYGRVTLSRTTSASTNSWIHVASGSRRNPALVPRARCSKDRDIVLHRRRRFASFHPRPPMHPRSLSLFLSLSLWLDSNCTPTTRRWQRARTHSWRGGSPGRSRRIRVKSGGFSQRGIRVRVRSRVRVLAACKR